MRTATLANVARGCFFFYAKKEVCLSNIAVKISKVSTKWAYSGTLFGGDEVRLVLRVYKPVVCQSFRDQSIVFLKGKCSAKCGYLILFLELERATNN